VEHTLSADDASRVTGATLVALGLAHDEADRLWELPAAALVDAQEQALSGLFTTIGSMPFHPVVDGDFLPAKPGVDFSAPSIDLLVTWTADEMRLYPNQHVDAGGRDRLIRWTQRLVAERIGSDPGRDRIEDLIEFYQDGAAGTDRTSGADIWAAIQTDALMRLPARRVALDHARSADIGRSTYIAQFDWRAHGGEWERGAFHAIDLPFTFATLDRCGWSDFLGVGDDGGRADELARRHMQRWGSFARSGDPGWAAVSADRRPTLVMNSEDRLDDDPLLDAAAAWEGLWSADGPPPA
jgi:carboxylesterase type B